MKAAGKGEIFVSGGEALSDKLREQHRDMKFPLTLKGGLYGNYKDSLDSQEGILYCAQEAG